MSRPPRLTLRETLDVLEIVEVALSDMMRRWDDGIAAEVRAEIAEPYAAVLQLLIRGGRRPVRKETTDA